MCIFTKQINSILAFVINICIREQRAFLTRSLCGSSYSNLKPHLTTTYCEPIPSPLFFPHFPSVPPPQYAQIRIIFQDSDPMPPPAYIFYIPPAKI